ncbi:MAG: hypothetical protein ACE5E5_12785 [Phycisphaerae bacterium]
MFGQLLSARIKAAEKALREGRLDEAFRMASNADLKGQKRAQAILQELAKRFYERARAHFHADRFTEALLDLQCARAGGSLQGKIDELKAHIEVVAAEAQRQAASHRARVEAAKQRIERGSLAAGREMLEQVGDDPGAEALLEDAAYRADDVARMVDQAADLMKQGRLAAAAERVARAKSIEAHSQRVTEIEAELCGQVIGTAKAALIEGHVDRAVDELRCLGSLGDDLSGKRELQGYLETCGAAKASLERFDYADAHRQALMLARKVPQAKWIKSVCDQLDQLETLSTALAAGPLGGSIERIGNAGRGSAEARPRVAARADRLDETIVLPGRIGSGTLPDRLLLLVDGGGSYLLHRGSRITFGRAASDHPADVAIFSDIPERCANITRVDDDYFLFAAKDVEVDGKQYRQKLLRDGDRITLGTRAKFTFRLPSRQSATATIDLSDTTKMPQDVRRVLVFDRHATIGQGGSAHILCRHASPALVLFEKDGGLWIRRKNDGHVEVAARPLAIGETLEIGGVNIALQPWRLRKTGSGWV